MGNIRDGYKQTDIGIIPEDWELMELGTVFATFPTAPYTRADLTTGDVKYIHYGDIHTKYSSVVFANQESMPTITVLKARKYTKLRDGDLLLADASEDYTGIGKGIEILNCSGINVISGLHTIPLRDKDQKYINGFRGYICQNKSTKQQLERQAVGTKVYSISYNSIKECLIPIPTKHEQKAIAEVLSDIDSLIEALDKKISKKRAIKEGAMQQLLTGNKRLSGFTEPWVEKKLGEIASMNSGGTPSSTNILYYDGEIPFLAISDISSSGRYITKTEKHITELGLQNSSARMFPKGTLMYAMYATLGKCSIAKIELSCSQAILGITPDKDIINRDFLYHLLYLKRQEVVELGQTGTQSNLSKAIVQDFDIKFPLSKQEQQTIVHILTNMDDEIELLEKERAKYIAIKQGAMQQLLTGQIRLTNISEQSQKSAEIRAIPIDAHVVGGHIVNKLHGSKGWGRTKLQKSLHLVGYCCQLDFGNEYIRNTAGPDDQLLMNHIDSKFKQYRHVRIESENNGRGGKHYNYIPTAMIAELEHVFESYPAETQKTADDLLDKIKNMDLPRAEIVSTLYAVWNNRIIKGQLINDDLLFTDFYDWSEHKSDFSQDLVLRALSYMRREGIIPVGWGKYIDKK